MSNNSPVSLRQLTNSGGVTLLPNLLLDAYHYYELSGDELILLIHLIRCQDSASGSDLPLSDYLMEKMRRSRGEITMLLQSLQVKGFLHLAKDAGQMKPQDTPLHFLYSSLISWTEIPEDKREVQEKDPFLELVQLFEKYFRYMNEFEYQRMREWLTEDQWDPEVIREALRIAALNKILNFKYIDRILLNWQIQGVHTLADVEAANNDHQSRRQQARGDETAVNQTQPVSKSRRRGVPLFRVGSINQTEETSVERKKRFDRLIE
ncbi:MAG: DnaD domain protein [Symbiobacteriaceae bacterium]|nr:DnaD domain protein [Symbiobacteriaceae bacterium]